MSDLSKADERLKNARDAIITLDERERIGIGMQREKTLHAILKYYTDPDPAHQEVPVCVIFPEAKEKYIADIYDGHRITEVQTSSFLHMNAKLRFFLPRIPVTVIYPIAHRKWITWIDPDTGELLKRNRSNFTGTYYQAFREMYQIRDILRDPSLTRNLTIRLMLLDMEEYRLQDGWGRDGKRGSHRYDLVPESIFDELALQNAGDYAVLLPGSLPEVFTAKDLQEAVGIHRKGVSFSQVLSVMTMVGAAERVGEGSRRAYLYRRTDADEASSHA